MANLGQHIIRRSMAFPFASLEFCISREKFIELAQAKVERLQKLIHEHTPVAAKSKVVDIISEKLRAAREKRKSLEYEEVRYSSDTDREYLKFRLENEQFRFQTILAFADNLPMSLTLSLADLENLNGETLDHDY